MSDPLVDRNCALLDGSCDCPAPAMDTCKKYVTAELINRPPTLETIKEARPGMFNCGFPLCPFYDKDAPTLTCPTPIQGSPCQGMRNETPDK